MQHIQRNQRNQSAHRSGDLQQTNISESNSINMNIVHSSPKELGRELSNAMYDNPKYFDIDDEVSERLIQVVRIAVNGNVNCGDILAVINNVQMSPEEKAGHLDRMIKDLGINGKEHREVAFKKFKDILCSGAQSLEFAFVKETIQYASLKQSMAVLKSMNVDMKDTYDKLKTFSTTPSSIITKTSQLKDHILNLIQLSDNFKAMHSLDKKMALKQMEVVLSSVFVSDNDNDFRLNDLAKSFVKIYCNDDKANSSSSSLFGSNKPGIVPSNNNNLRDELLKNNPMRMDDTSLRNQKRRGSLSQEDLGQRINGIDFPIGSPAAKDRAAERTLKLISNISGKIKAPENKLLFLRSCSAAHEKIKSLFQNHNGTIVKLEVDEIISLVQKSLESNSQIPESDIKELITNLAICDHHTGGAMGMTKWSELTRTAKNMDESIQQQIQKLGSINPTTISQSFNTIISNLSSKDQALLYGVLCNSDKIICPPHLAHVKGDILHMKTEYLREFQQYFAGLHDSGKQFVRNVTFKSASASGKDLYYNIGKSMKGMQGELIQLEKPFFHLDDFNIRQGQSGSCYELALLYKAVNSDDQQQQAATKDLLSSMFWKNADGSIGIRYFPLKSFEGITKDKEGKSILGNTILYSAIDKMSDMAKNSTIFNESGYSLKKSNYDTIEFEITAEKAKQIETESSRNWYNVYDHSRTQGTHNTIGVALVESSSGVMGNLIAAGLKDQPVDRVSLAFHDNKEDEKNARFHGTKLAGQSVDYAFVGQLLQLDTAMIPMNKKMVVTKIVTESLQAGKFFTMGITSNNGHSKSIMGLPTGHAYSVDKINFEPDGGIKEFILRNPHNTREEIIVPSKVVFEDYPNNFRLTEFSHSSRGSNINSHNKYKELRTLATGSNLSGFEKAINNLINSSEISLEEKLNILSSKDMNDATLMDYILYTSPEMLGVFINTIQSNKVLSESNRDQILFVSSYHLGQGHIPQKNLQKYISSTDIMPQLNSMSFNTLNQSIIPLLNGILNKKNANFANHNLFTYPQWAMELTPSNLSEIFKIIKNQAPGILKSFLTSITSLSLDAESNITRIKNLIQIFHDNENDLKVIINKEFIENIVDNPSKTEEFMKMIGESDLPNKYKEKILHELHKSSFLGRPSLIEKINDVSILQQVRGTIDKYFNSSNDKKDVLTKLDAKIKQKLR